VSWVFPLCDMVFLLQKPRVSVLSTRPEVREAPISPNCRLRFRSQFERHFLKPVRAFRMPCALLHHVTHRFGGGPEFAIETQIAMVHLFRRWTSRGAARCIQEQGPTIAETSLVAPAFYLGCIACRAFSGLSDALRADHRQTGHNPNCE